MEIPQRERRTTPTQFPEAAIARLEHAFVHRASEIEACIARGELDGKPLTENGRFILGLMAREDRLLAGELRYW